MEFGQLIEYIVKRKFLQNHAENEAGIPVPDLLLFFKKASHKIRASI